MRGSNPATIWRWPESATARLREEFPQVEIAEYEAPSDLPPPAGAEAVWAGAEAAVAVRLHRELLQAAPRLGWVHCPSAAVHQLLTPELIASPAVVTNGAPVHAATVAEHAVALLLALLRGLPQALAQQAEQRWDAAALLAGMGELRGSVALIVGMGHIGSEVAKRLAAFEARVIGVRRRPMHTAAGVAEMHPPEALLELLPRADHVVLALPATSATEAILGERELAAMRPGARLVNVGRGAAIEEAALAAALRRGHLAGAALDVARREPLPPASPLWTAPRLLLTPHVAAVNPRVWERQAEIIARHLRRWLAGERPHPLVDKQRGY